MPPIVQQPHTVWHSLEIEQRSLHVVIAIAVIGGILLIGALVRSAVWPSRVYCTDTSCPTRPLSTDANLAILVVGCVLCLAVWIMTAFIVIAPGVHLDQPYRDKGIGLLFSFLCFWSVIQLLGIYLNEYV